MRREEMMEDQEPSLTMSPVHKTTEEVSQQSWLTWPLPRPALPGRGLRAPGREDLPGGEDGGEGAAGGGGAGELRGLSQEV